MAELEFVAVDIETTGSNVDDKVTVVGFELPLGCRVFLQAEEDTLDGELAALEATGVEWPFRDMPYADLLPMVMRRFNVTVDSEEESTLPAEYKPIVGGDLNERDPFDDSTEAVAAFTEARYADLAHNVVDVLRTGELGAMTRRYCSKSDIVEITDTDDSRHMTRQKSRQQHDQQVSKA